MEIVPATLAQVRAGRDGRRVLIEDDVLDVAQQLKAIDESLSLHWNEQGSYFVVIHTDEKGTENLVLTARELDNRVIDRVRQIGSANYDFLAEVDRLDKQAERDADHRFSERTGEIGERLAHAVRQDLQAKNKIILPRGV